jgi:hypothetical protein
LRWKLIYLQNTSIKHCCVQLVSNIINHASPNFQTTELHTQWHWCLHFRMSLNSQRYLQFHPTVILMAYVNSCFIIICQNLFPVSFYSSGSIKLLVRPHAGIVRLFPLKHQTSCMHSKRSPKVIWIWAIFLSNIQEFMFEMCFHENKREWMYFLL